MLLLATCNDRFFLSNRQDVLRMEYRSKFLNPKWRDAMLQQGSGGAYEVSQRMTAMIGWAATAEGKTLPIPIPLKSRVITLLVIPCS